jgi:hypothetical protein
MEAGLLRRFPTSEQAGKCASAMAFYRLRKILDSLGRGQGEIKPGVQLATLGLPTPKQLFRILRRDLDVAAPEGFATWIGVTGLIFVFAGFLALAGVVIAHAAIHIDWVWLSLIAMLPAGIGLLAVDPRSFAELTVGDLAKDLAWRNYGHFADLGADRRPPIIWRQLRQIIAEQTGFAAGRIGRETRFF